MSSDEEETEVVNQQVILLAPPPPVVDIPPGFERLVPLCEVSVQQEIDLFEIVCNCEVNNKYSVKAPNGREIFRVTEASGCCCRWCCGRFRPFKAIIDDFEGHEIVVKRRLAWNSCWCPCWLQKLKVYSPPGNLIGRVSQSWTCCKPKFVVFDEYGRRAFRIKGPCCTGGCCPCSNIHFVIYSADDNREVGRITKKWGGFVREAYSDADNFGISFPLETDVKLKAVLLGACLLIDFMFFERSGNRPNNS